MPVKNIFTVEKGNLTGQSFIYKGEEVLMLGRRRDSSIVFTDATVSSNHCILEISQQSVLVRDCNSTNGTFINGKRIGRREADNSDDETRKTAFPMKSGDVLGLGKNCQLRLEVKKIQLCSICGTEVEDITHRASGGAPICTDCHGDPKKVLKYLMQKAQAE